MGRGQGAAGCGGEGSEAGGLHNNQLSGTIPASLGNLTALQYLCAPGYSGPWLNGPCPAYQQSARAARVGSGAAQTRTEGTSISRSHMEEAG